MTFVGQDKPSLEELALKHFGVKGMKWGVRKKRGEPSKSRQIKDARKRLRSQQREIYNLYRQGNKAKTPSERAKFDKLAMQKAKKFLESPDHLTASRLTTGEKVALALLGGVAVTTVLAPAVSGR